jgi:hypothetical protein
MYITRRNARKPLAIDRKTVRALTADGSPLRDRDGSIPSNLTISPECRVTAPI